MFKTFNPQTISALSATRNRRGRRTAATGTLALVAAFTLMGCSEKDSTDTSQRPTGSRTQPPAEQTLTVAPEPEVAKMVGLWDCGPILSADGEADPYTYTSYMAFFPNQTAVSHTGLNSADHDTPQGQKADAISAASYTDQTNPENETAEKYELKPGGFTLTTLASNGAEVEYDANVTSDDSFTVDVFSLTTGNRSERTCTRLPEEMWQEGAN